MMVWHNGEWKSEEDACLGIYDGGFLRGEGFFETIWAWQGRLWEGVRHLRRYQAAHLRWGWDDIVGEDHLLTLGKNSYFAMI